MYADIIIVHQPLRTHLPAKGSASAMKTFEGTGELHGLPAEVSLPRRGPARRSGGKGSRREDHIMAQARSNSSRVAELWPKLRLCHTAPILSSCVKCFARMRRRKTRRQR